MVGETSNGLQAYYQRGYRIKVKIANYLSWPPAPSGDYYTNLRIEVDATMIGGPEDNDFGVMCRYQDSENFYGLVIASDGYALIFKFEKGIYSGLSGARFEAVDGINSGQELNHIVAVCNGDSLELYVNDNLVASATDSSFSDGEIALVAGTSTVGGTDILFDNLFVRNPE